MKPQKGSELLRKGRVSIKNQHYLITTTVLERKPVFNQIETAQIVLDSLHWLEKQGQILLDAAIVMPDHLHFVAGLRQSSLSKLMHSFKGYTAYKINELLKKKGEAVSPTRQVSDRMGFFIVSSKSEDHLYRKISEINGKIKFTIEWDGTICLVKKPGPPGPGDEIDQAQTRTFRGSHADRKASVGFPSDRGQDRTTSWATSFT